MLEAWLQGIWNDGKHFFLFSSLLHLNPLMQTGGVFEVLTALAPLSLSLPLQIPTYPWADVPICGLFPFHTGCMGVGVGGTYLQPHSPSLAADGGPRLWWTMRTVRADATHAISQTPNVASPRLHLLHPYGRNAHKSRHSQLEYGRTSTFHRQTICFSQRL